MISKNVLVASYPNNNCNDSFNLCIPFWICYICILIWRVKESQFIKAWASTLFLRVSLLLTDTGKRDGSGLPSDWGERRWAVVFQRVLAFPAASYLVMCWKPRGPLSRTIKLWLLQTLKELHLKLSKLGLQTKRPRRGQYDSKKMFFFPLKIYVNPHFSSKWCKLKHRYTQVEWKWSPCLCLSATVIYK